MQDVLKGMAFNVRISFDSEGVPFAIVVTGFSTD